jgi:hypothetical protein
MVVVRLSVTVVLPCVALVAMLRSAVTIMAARIMVADGGMVPVPSLLVWRSVPPLVPQQPPHIIIIMAATPRITVRHLTRQNYPNQGRCRSLRGASSFEPITGHYFRTIDKMDETEHNNSNPPRNITYPGVSTECRRCN